MENAQHARQHLTAGGLAVAALGGLLLRGCAKHHQAPHPFHCPSNGHSYSAPASRGHLAPPSASRLSALHRLLAAATAVSGCCGAAFVRWGCAAVLYSVLAGVCCALCAAQPAEGGALPCQL